MNETVNSPPYFDPFFWFLGNLNTEAYTASFPVVNQDLVRLLPRHLEDLLSIQ